MKKIMAVFSMLVIILSWTSVSAASLCSNERKVELQKMASAVKLTYEEAQEEADPDSYISIDEANPETIDEYEEILYNDYFKIKILNLNENLYIKLENSLNDDVKYITYDDTIEGNYTLDWKNLNEVVTFTYTIYSSEKTECMNEKIKSGMLTLPKYNRNYTNTMCEEVPDYYLCQKYISVNVTEEQFYDYIMAYTKKESSSNDNADNNGNADFSIIEFLKENKKILIIGLTVLVVGGGIATVIVIKKRRSRVI